MSNSTKLRLLGALAVVLVVVGIVLVVTGDDEPTGPSTTTTTVADGQAPTATLPLDDTSVKGVSSMAGLVVPDAAKDFLTAATENKAQLDVTFTLPSGQVAIAQRYAANEGLAMGDDLTLAFADGTSRTFQVGAIFEVGDLVVVFFLRSGEEAAYSRHAKKGGDHVAKLDQLAL